MQRKLQAFLQHLELRISNTPTPHPSRALAGPARELPPQRLPPSRPPLTHRRAVCGASAPLRPALRSRKNRRGPTASTRAGAHTRTRTRTQSGEPLPRPCVTRMLPDTPIITAAWAHAFVRARASARALAHLLACARLRARANTRTRRRGWPASSASSGAGSWCPRGTASPTPSSPPPATPAPSSRSAGAWEIRISETLVEMLALLRQTPTSPPPATPAPSSRVRTPPR